MTATLTYQRPFLYPKQQDALFSEKRYVVVEASTKSGKTVGCLVWLHEQAALYGSDGRNYWWIAPIRRVAKIAYRRLKHYQSTLTKLLPKTRRQKERKIRLTAARMATMPKRALMSSTPSLRKRNE